MNHLNIYNKIINNALQEKRKKYNGTYYELHHILPKSLFPEKANLNLNKENGVLLTAREHFFCHQLLTKIYPGYQMIYALFRLCNDKQNKYCVKGSKEYERIKKECAKINGILMSERNRGKKRTEESRQKYSAAKKGVLLSEEHKLSLSQAAKNKFKDENMRKKYSDAAKKRYEKYGPVFEKKHSKESTKKISDTLKKYRWWTSGEKSTFSEICPEGWTSGRGKFNKHKNIDSIYCVETKERWENIKIFAKQKEISSSYAHVVLTRGYYKNLHYKYELQKYINLATNKIRTFEKNQPIPKEYVLYDDKKDN